MFKKINKSGMAIHAVIYFLFAAVTVAGFSLRPKHIIRRSVEKCVAAGETNQVCTDKVNSWTQEERIEYIRDRAEVTTNSIGNGGNFVHGYMN